MFKQKDTLNPDSVDTIIGTNTVIEGFLESQGTIRVDGKVKGDIKAAGDVFVGTNGTVTGNINASNVYLSGAVEGNVTTKGVLRILSTAKLIGDIFVKSFVTDEGGILQGKCTMIETTESEKSVSAIRSKKDSKDNKKASSDQNEASA